MLAFNRRILCAMFVAAVLVPGGSAMLSTPAHADDLTLLMYERAGCVWCARWDKEVAPVYPLTNTGKRVALRRVNLDRPKADDPRLADPVRFTPTFVLMQGNREVGRITGYHDDGFFWGLLDSMVTRHAAPPPASNKS